VTGTLMSHARLSAIGIARTFFKPFHDNTQSRIEEFGVVISHLSKSHDPDIPFGSIRVTAPSTDFAKGGDRGAMSTSFIYIRTHSIPPHGGRCHHPSYKTPLLETTLRLSGVQHECKQD